ncbi:undecaprenyl-diphosphatase UppP [Desulfitobacterium metallireducens]|uniref:Undecaprenyl-diphosphatase n=1 Tax=Desulfitobacterium metallireducens DSM 15288 TaxID=871968 RepID=W0EAY3_9FIRM|nr:undecaprenyl-diphosphatase UppP [Desulfitobacterium metallireducens]AHF06663.1 UDP-diphosphatase [Desulfitobacterium metallireducens DSM 15288]
MTIFQAIILGIVQGLGEFLPISSSAHLVLIPWLFGWKDMGLAFDVALHMGTLLAVVLYFWKDWIGLLKGALSRKPSNEKRLFWYLVIATVPGALIGFILEDKAATVFRSPLLIGIMLIILGIVLYWADNTRQLRTLETMTLMDAILIGLSQSLAIIPGVSRAGSTMTTARLLSLTREDAARFSFLMSTPIIMGAGLLSVRHLQPSDINLAFAIGIITAFIVGLFSISFLLRYLKTSNFKIFVGYRFFIGLGVILVFFFR